MLIEVGGNHCPGKNMTQNFCGWTMSTTIVRLNSGTTNSHNLFISANFRYPFIEYDSVNHADSKDIKILIQFPGKISLENFAQNLKLRGLRPCAWAFYSQSHPKCSAAM